MAVGGQTVKARDSRRKQDLSTMQQAQKWIEKAAPMVDVLGGLPSRDRPHQAEHLDYIFSMAKDLGKTVDVHIDQNNDPDEKDTEILAKKVIEHGMQGKVNAVHCCSLAAQKDDYMMEVIKLIKEADMSVIICPRAMIDGVQMREKMAPVHNSIGPVPQLVEAGVNVCLGVDNVHDYFCPFIDGNVFEELIFLIETCRFYDIDELVNIATVNGRKALGVA
ncbi:amidohydrolase family protein [candidate division KSB1 bacterium]